MHHLSLHYIFFHSPPRRPGNKYQNIRTKRISPRGQGNCHVALGGYSLPPSTTLGSQVHSWSAGTESRTVETWFPQPFQAVLPFADEAVSMCTIQCATGKC
ncbi:hypothetical protein F5Y01DRAFT_162944 [Xylaria sp. FL0043]|nr:hypothetical protein F5Y01DRAFT_162944 [Xylaria sp. FL0043]